MGSGLAGLHMKDVLSGIIYSVSELTSLARASLSSVSKAQVSKKHRGVVSIQTQRLMLYL